LFPAGGIATADGRWISLPPGDALPVEVLRERFQKIFLKRVKRLYRAGRLTLDGELAELRDPERFAQWHDRLAARRWVVYVDKATAHGNPRDPGHGERIVRYMARYASGMVMSNHRLISIDDGHVTFFYKDYRDGERRKVRRMPALEFIDRLLDHHAADVAGHVADDPLAVFRIARIAVGGGRIDVGDPTAGGQGSDH